MIPPFLVVTSKSRKNSKLQFNAVLTEFQITSQSWFASTVASPYLDIKNAISQEPRGHRYLSHM